MAYTKQTWEDNNPDYPVSADRMTHIEDGIASAQNKADSALQPDTDDPYAKFSDLPSTPQSVQALPAQVGAYGLTGVIVVPHGADPVVGSQYNGIPVIELDEEVASNIVRVHHCDGTAGTASSAALEGFDSGGGTPPNYVSDGYINTSIEFPGGSSVFYRDDLTAQYLGMYVKIPSALSGGCNIAMAQTSEGGVTSAALTVRQDGTIQINSSLTTTEAVSTTALAVDTWYRLEWYVGDSTQELRIFTDPASSTPAETLTGSTASVLTRWMLGTTWAANDSGPVRLDEITICSGWPDMAAA